MTLAPMLAETDATPQDATKSMIDRALAELVADGVTVLPPLVSESALHDMQAAFANRLRYMSCGNVAGYKRGELFRLTVDDALTLSQGFVDIGLHPIVTGVIGRYVGPNYGLCEAKGWQTQPTTVDFNSWHGDAWYDQDAIVNEIPREVKLAFFLSDVTSGAFQYLKGTHRSRAPSALKKDEKQNLDMQQMVEFKNNTGTAVLFDTSGIHRQGVPILEPRRAVFYNYHDRDVPVQREDVTAYRYHPLILNAAYLGDLTPEQYRVLGFGHKGRLQPDFVKSPRHPWLHAAITQTNTLALSIDGIVDRVTDKLGRILKV